jgi:hypothetical protein
VFAEVVFALAGQEGLAVDHKGDVPGLNGREAVVAGLGRGEGPVHFTDQVDAPVGISGGEAGPKTQVPFSMVGQPVLGMSKLVSTSEALVPVKLSAGKYVPVRPGPVPDEGDSTEAGVGGALDFRSVAWRGVGVGVRGWIDREKGDGSAHVVLLEQPTILRSERGYSCAISGNLAQSVEAAREDGSYIFRRSRGPLVDRKMEHSHGRFCERYRSEARGIFSAPAGEGVGDDGGNLVTVGHTPTTDHGGSGSCSDEKLRHLVVCLQVRRRALVHF